MGNVEKGRMPKPQGDAYFLVVLPYSCPTATALFGPGILNSSLREFVVLCGTGSTELCLVLAKCLTWL